MVKCDRYTIKEYFVYLYTNQHLQPTCSPYPGSGLGRLALVRSVERECGLSLLPIDRYRLRLTLSRFSVARDSD